MATQLPVTRFVIRLARKVGTTFAIRTPPSKPNALTRSQRPPGIPPHLQLRGPFENAGGDWLVEIWCTGC
ncbi:hypothetical protein OPV22_013629 [Ensete ventricosum]|uniref:Uncharacterized protein n=1 Tax=Ensete ventricosum TaxID=4639 RepID=A0AAV8R7X6_ENSVE|nr:hypothetical protein OPV22_013629 [Ensete ventricosum]